MKRLITAYIFAAFVFAPLIDTGEWERWETVTVDVRAYCPKECCCRHFADGLFCTLEPAKGKAIASSSLPLGTQCYVQGYGEAEVKDKGPNLIEVFFESHAEAVEWGVKKDTDVQILRQVQRPGARMPGLP